jgi:hypothetical protein
MQNWKQYCTNMSADKMNYFNGQLDAIMQVIQPLLSSLKMHSERQNTALLEFEGTLKFLSANAALHKSELEACPNRLQNDLNSMEKELAQLEMHYMNNLKNTIRNVPRNDKQQQLTKRLLGEYGGTW